MNPAMTPEHERVSWPYASLLLFGFFGMDSPGGRRLALRTAGALVLLAVSAIGTRGGLPGPVPPLAWAVGVPLAVGVIWWAYARYLGELDELSRLIQFGAFAFAYGAAMTGALAILAFGYVTGEPGPIHPSSILLILLAEGLRGIALARLAKRYS